MPGNLSPERKAAFSAASPTGPLDPGPDTVVHLTVRQTTPDTSTDHTGLAPGLQTAFWTSARVPQVSRFWKPGIPPLPCSARGLDKTRADAPRAESLGKDFWKSARIVLPPGKTSVHLRLDSDIVEWFRSRGKGHLTRMNAVLRAYVEAQNRSA